MRALTVLTLPQAGRLSGLLPLSDSLINSTECKWVAWARSKRLVKKKKPCVSKIDFHG